MNSYSIKAGEFGLDRFVLHFLVPVLDDPPLSDDERYEQVLDSLQTFLSAVTRKLRNFAKVRMPLVSTSESRVKYLHPDAQRSQTQSKSSKSSKAKETEKPEKPKVRFHDCLLQWHYAQIPTVYAQYSELLEKGQRTWGSELVCMF